MFMKLMEFNFLMTYKNILKKNITLLLACNVGWLPSAQVQSLIIWPLLKLVFLTFYVFSDFNLITSQKKMLKNVQGLSIYLSHSSAKILCGITPTWFICKF